MQTETRNDVLSREIAELDNELRNTEGRLQAAQGRVGTLEREAEAAEELVLGDEGKQARAALNEARQRLQEARTEAGALPRVISRMSMALAEKRKEWERLEATRQHAARLAERRRDLEAWAGLVGALAGYAASGAEVPNYQAWQNQSTPCRTVIVNLAMMIDSHRCGTSDFLPVAIERLRAAAPDLVTPGMEKCIEVYAQKIDRLAQERRYRDAHLNQVANADKAARQREQRTVGDMVGRFGIIEPGPVDSKTASNRSFAESRKSNNVVMNQLATSGVTVDFTKN